MITVKQPPDQLAQFEGHRYLSLKTFRKDGTAVPTPMCYIIENGVLYLRTSMTSWKVKRIQNNPAVQVVPSDGGGKPKGTWIEGKAQLFPVGEMGWVYSLFKKKYRFEQRLVDLMIKLRKLTYIVIAVRIAERPLPELTSSQPDINILANGH